MALADKMLEWSDRLREKAKPGLSEGDSGGRRTNVTGRDNNPQDAVVAPSAAVPLAESERCGHEVTRTVCVICDRVLTEEDEMEVHVYKDKAGEWRWRKVAANGRIVADSGEGYTRYADALEAAEKFADGENIVGPDEIRRIEPK